MPAEALELIQEQFSWCTPGDLVPEIQRKFPHITRAQVYTAWSTLSQKSWQRSPDQVTLARALLSEYGKGTEILNLSAPDGVEMIAWGTSKIASRLSGKIAEIVIDATCKSFSILSATEHV
jgi:hypothetical protein